MHVKMAALNLNVRCKSQLDTRFSPSAREVLDIVDFSLHRIIRKSGYENVITIYFQAAYVLCNSSVSDNYLYNIMRLINIMYFHCSGFRRCRQLFLQKHR